MSIKLDEKAVEGSTFIIMAEFNERNPDGTLTPFVPNSGLKWTLSHKDGTPIRENVSIVPPAQSVKIVLSGTDLEDFPGKSTRRYVTIEGTYNGVGGNDLPLIEEASFQIKNLVGV